MKAELRALLEEFKYCFAWSYHEMPGLDRTLVEHELRIKPGCKPFRQPPQRFSTEVQLGIKDELVRLLKARFIRTARYVEWLANIVPVLKKSGALRICIDFRNLNLATPKDEYTMPPRPIIRSYLLWMAMPGTTKFSLSCHSTSRTSAPHTNEQ
ncbi:hypothetical protein ACFX2I_012695 [Malus domestica]